MNQVEQDILRVAIKLFAEKGYVATSVRDIADEVKIKPASLYHYMSGKKDLLKRIMDIYLGQLNDNARKALEKNKSKTESEKLVSLINNHILNHADERLAALVIDTEYRSLEGIHRDEVRKLRSAYEDLWIDVPSKGKESGEFHFKDAKITAYALISLCTSVIHWFREGKTYNISQISEQYADLGLNMVKQIEEGN